VGDPDILDDRRNNEFTITAQYAVPKLAVEHGAYWFVRFSPTNMIGVLATPPSATRTTPLQLPLFPYDARYTFEVKFPAEVNVISLPRANTVDNKYFNYTVKSSFRGDTSKTVMELATFADQVEISDLKTFSEDMRSLANIVVGVVVVPKIAIKSVKSAAATKKDVAQSLRDQVNETIDKTTLAIRSGRLSSADLAGAYCLRSSARSHLGMSKDALADADEAVKLMPNASDSLRCRAQTLFLTGEFEKAITDYSKSIALGATDAKILQQRGIAKFYAGRLGCRQEARRQPDLSHGHRNDVPRSARDLKKPQAVRNRPRARGYFDGVGFSAASLHQLTRQSRCALEIVKRHQNFLRNGKGTG